MDEITLVSLVRRAEGFTTAQVRDDLMMLQVEQGAYYSLDPIAAEIWRLLEQPGTVQQLVEKLVQHYTVSPEQCQADVLAFLEEMRRNGMIQTP
jgi:hypothetical protein